jgi:hypothetical protein
MPMTDGIEWVEADVRGYDPSGFDCIALLGLLYHLELDAQLALLRKCAGTPIIVDTHHAPSAGGHPAGLRWPALPGAGHGDEERQQIATTSVGQR